MQLITKLFIAIPVAILGLGLKVHAEAFSSTYGVVDITSINGSEWEGTYLDGRALLYGTMSDSGFFTGHWIRKDSKTTQCNYPVAGSYYWGRVNMQFDSVSFEGRFGHCDNELSGDWSGKFLPPAQYDFINLDGWWEGNNSGYYSIQTNGNAFQMKGFRNNGSLLNIYDGTIAGNKVTGRWKNYCNSKSGSTTLLYTNGLLKRIAGSSKNTAWSRSSKPSNIRTKPSCSDTNQSKVRLDGWWKGNKSGYYSIQTNGNTFQMKGFRNNGSLLNIYDGTIAGNKVIGRWKNYCNSKSGSTTLLYTNGLLKRIAGSSKNTAWSRSSKPSNVSNKPRCKK